MEIATFAGGCFWCTEAIFQKLKGVLKVTPGYCGGQTKNPSYEEVCSGKTNHAESIQIEFNPKIISYQRLLEVFFALHDPTTPNQQGADIGSQYRSVIFTHNENQKLEAIKTIEKLEKSNKYQNKIVTEIEPFQVFYKAENYHKDFYKNNRTQPFCQIVIDPKISKLTKEFKNEVKVNSVDF